MKKFTKISLIAILVCVVLGLGFLIGGIALGGTFTEFGNAFRRGDFTIGSGEYQEHTYNFTSSIHHKGEETVESAVSDGDYDDIKEIKVDMGWGGIYMEESEDKSFYVDVSGGDADKIKVTQNNGRLIITSNSKHVRNQEVTIYCPSKAQFDLVDITVGAGEAGIDVPIYAKELKVDIGAGSFEANEQISADTSNWSVGAGEVVLDELSGSDMTFDCGVGSMDITIDGKQENYDYNIDCGMGSLTVGESDFAGVSKQTIKSQNSNGKHIKASCGVGELTIDFD